MRICYYGQQNKKRNIYEAQLSILEYYESFKEQSAIKYLRILAFILGKPGKNRKFSDKQIITDNPRTSKLIQRLCNRNQNCFYRKVHKKPLMVISILQKSIEACFSIYPKSSSVIISLKDPHAFEVHFSSSESFEANQRWFSTSSALDWSLMWNISGALLGS